VAVRFVVPSRARARRKNWVAPCNSPVPDRPRSCHAERSEASSLGAPHGTMSQTLRGFAPQSDTCVCLQGVAPSGPIATPAALGTTAGLSPSAPPAARASRKAVSKCHPERKRGIWVGGMAASWCRAISPPRSLDFAHFVRSARDDSGGRAHCAGFQGTLLLRSSCRGAERRWGVERDPQLAGQGGEAEWLLQEACRWLDGCSPADVLLRAGRHENDPEIRPAVA
jgi:hypothetical protein